MSLRFRELVTQGLVISLFAQSALINYCQPSLAQQQLQQQKGFQLPNMNKYRQTPQTRDAEEYRSDRLTAPIELTDIPQYTGRAVFVTGLKYPRDRSGMRVGMTFGVQEGESEVLEWYKSALKTYKWSLLSESVVDKSISAAKGKNSFTLRISPSKQPGFRTLMVQSYKFGI